MRSYMRLLITINICFIIFCEAALIELEPVIITTKLGDTIELSIPKPNTRYTIELTNPRGEVVYRRSYNNSNIYSNRENNCLEDILHKDIYKIGPLEEKDHGNWILSNEFIDGNGKYVEVFKVFSVEIIENITSVPEKVQLNTGDTYQIKLEGKIENLLSCQIIPPKSSRDTFYERDFDYKKLCAFTVKNISLYDTGIWRIIAVGNIIFEGVSFLNVSNKHL